jgi:hypothetical protein
MKNLLLLIFFTVEVGILIIAQVVAPENAGLQYWGSVLWLCALVALNWLASASIFTGSATLKSETSESGSSLGVLPGLNLILLLYSLGSLGVLALTVGFAVISWKWQLALQVAGLVITAVIGLSMFVAVTGAEHGSVVAVTKAQLLSELRRIKRSSSDAETVKLLDEAVAFVSYQVPHPSKLDSQMLRTVLDQMVRTSEGSKENADAILKSLRQL